MSSKTAILLNIFLVIVIASFLTAIVWAAFCFVTWSLLPVSAMFLRGLFVAMIWAVGWVMLRDPCFKAGDQ